MMQIGNKRWLDYLFQERMGLRSKLIFSPLFAISWLYGWIVRARLKLYQGGILKEKQLPCKVISVGNMTLGGTGKTPMVAYLARELQKRDIRVGILSRGYKGFKERKGGLLSDGINIYMNPAEAGDEPSMLAKKLRGVPLMVGKNRYVMGLYGCEKFGLDVVLLDDGFQHVALKRDLDIVLIDARSGFGNGHLFPRGPLREPIKGLRRASIVVISKAESPELLGDIEAVLHRLTPTIPIYHSRYKPVYLFELASGKVFPPDYLRGRRILAFAGVADPGYFVHLLKLLGAEVVKEVHFSDHHRYSPSDLVIMGEYMNQAELFVTTEKDCVKLQNIHIDRFPIVVLGIEQEILKGESFLDKVLSVIVA
jgi:tetraacyldisaccharide 4'-kinase